MPHCHICHQDWTGVHSCGGTPTACGPSCAKPVYGLSQFSDEEIAREHHYRMMRNLGDQSVGVTILRFP